MNPDFWLRLALAALLITGVWSAFAPGMIFHPIGQWAERRLHEVLTMPTFGCPVCMSSFWGTIVWFYAGGDWWWWVPFILALAGVMRLLSDNFIRHE